MEPPIPITQLIDELKEEATPERVKDIEYFEQQKEISEEHRIELLKVILPHLKKFRPMGTLLSSIACLIDEDTVDEVIKYIEDVVDKLMDEFLTDIPPCAFLFYKLCRYEMLSEKEVGNLIHMIRTISCDETSMNFILDGLFHVFSVVDFGEVPMFSTITIESNENTLMRLVNLLLTCPTKSYEDLLNQILEKSNNEELLVRTIRCYSNVEYSIASVFHVMDRVPKQSILEAAAYVLNVSSDDDERRRDTVLCGGINWIFKMLNQEISLKTTRGLYGYV